MTARDRIILPIVCLISFACPGCGPRRCPINYDLASSFDLRHIRRVALIELAGDKCAPQVAADMTEALFQAMQAKRLFHVDVIRRTDAVCRDLPLDRMEPYALENFSKMQQALRCDGAVIGKISHFQTYPRLRIGLYLRLLDLRNGAVVWAVDHTWDTTDKKTEERIKKFFKRHLREGYDPLQWRLATQSPRTFQKFIAYEIVEHTLPTRSEVLRPAKASIGGRRSHIRVGRRGKTELR